MNTIEEIKDRMKQLLAEPCDCVLSVRAATTCWRCKKLEFLQNSLEGR